MPAKPPLHGCVSAAAAPRPNALIACPAGAAKDQKCPPHSPQNVASLAGPYPSFPVPPRHVTSLLAWVMHQCSEVGLYLAPRQGVGTGQAPVAQQNRLCLAYAKGMAVGCSPWAHQWATNCTEMGQSPSLQQRCQCPLQRLPCHSPVTFSVQVTQHFGDLQPAPIRPPHQHEPRKRLNSLFLHYDFCRR